MRPNELMFKDVLIYFLLAFFICFLSVFVISFICFKNLYNQSIEETSRSISGALKSEEVKYSNIVSSFAVWNQSYENIYVNYNQKWVEENIVYDLEKIHNIPFFAIVNSETHKVIYSTENKILEKDNDLSADFKVFLDSHAPVKDKENSNSEFVTLNSLPYLFSVSPISHVDMNNRQGAVHPTKLLIVIGTALDGNFFSKISHHYNLQNLEFFPLNQYESRGSQPSYLLHENNKDLGYLTWSSQDKTKSLLITIIPTGLIVIFLMSLIGLLVARKLSRVSYKYEQMVWELSDLACTLEKEKHETTSVNEIKAKFLSMVSHQIRTPMTGLVGMISLLKETELNDAQIKYVNTMELSAGSLLRLVDSTLEYGRLEAGEVSLSFTNMNIRNLVDEIHGLLLPIALQRKLKFEVFYSKDVPLVIRSDAIRLRQIILHLVTNALKFTRVGSIKINLTAILLSEVRTQICIQVIDTGVGIAEGLRQALFEEFFKVDNGVQQSSEGIGLGLVIVRNLTSLLQGKVGIESKLGQGSTFWVEFPAEVVKAYGKAGEEK